MPKKKHTVPYKWNYLGWFPPRYCDKGYFLLNYLVEDGWRHFYLLGHHWLKPSEDNKPYKQGSKTDKE